MQFDSSQAWDRAISWVRANLAMLVPVAGIFLLLPGLGFTWFTTDLSLAIDSAAKASKPGQPSWAMLPLVGQYLGILFVIGFIQSIGTMAMLALFSDRSRPTVGESIKQALRALPSAIGASVLLLLGGLVAALPLIVIAGLVAAALSLVAGVIGSTAIVTALALAAFMLLASRMVLVTPLIVLDKVFNPATAIARSWAMTRGNTVRLAFFLFLLMIAYVVIAMAAQALVGLALGVGILKDDAQIAAAGQGVRLGVGLVTGLVGASGGVIFTAISGAIYEQLQRATPQGVSGLFD